MVTKQKQAERIERKQQKIDAGVVSARYPDVASIVISMDYYKRGPGPAFLKRTVNFSPGSFAYFLMECMEDSCIDGGFDLDPVILNMVRGHLTSAKGALVCSGNDSSKHRRIDYQIAIQYSQQ